MPQRSFFPWWCKVENQRGAKKSLRSENLVSASKFDEVDDSFRLEFCEASGCSVLHSLGKIYHQQFGLVVSKLTFLQGN